MRPEEEEAALPRDVGKTAWIFAEESIGQQDGKSRRRRLDAGRTSSLESASRDVVKLCLQSLDECGLGRFACASRSCLSFARSAWPDLVRRLYPSAFELEKAKDEASAKRLFQSQRRRRLLCDKLSGPHLAALSGPVIRSLADVVFFVRLTDGGRLLWEGDARGSFEIDHIAIDLFGIWPEAKPRWPHLAKLFELRQAHGRSSPPATTPPDFVIDQELEDAAFKNVAISLVAVRAADGKMCILAKLTAVERVDLKDLDYGFSTQPIEAKSYMTFREPAQQARIQGFLQFFTDDASEGDDDIDCVNLFVTAGKCSPPNSNFVDDFAEDFDLCEHEVVTLFDSFQWT